MQTVTQSQSARASTGMVARAYLLTCSCSLFLMLPPCQQECFELNSGLTDTVQNPPGGYISHFVVAQG